VRVLRNIIVFILAFVVLFPAPGFAATLQVGWNANTDKDLLGYQLYYGTTAGTYSMVVDVGKVTSYQITGVQSGTTCYVAVSAYDSSRNESALSVVQTVSVPATAPPVVTGISLTSPAAGATVTSNPVLSWTGSGFSSYKVYISISGKTYSRIYTGTKTSCSMQSTLWSWFIPHTSTITWYVEGTKSTGAIVKSVTSRFIKK
jgi:hypothetical protein